MAADVVGAGGTADPALVGLAAPLAAEVALARAELALSGADSRFVMNSVTGVAHRVVVGFGDSRPTGWLAACGWRFGLAIWRSAPVQLCLHELPKAPQLLCARCMPDLRRASASALAHLEA